METVVTNETNKCFAIFYFFYKIVLFINIVLYNANTVRAAEDEKWCWCLYAYVCKGVKYSSRREGDLFFFLSVCLFYFLSPSPLIWLGLTSDTSASPRHDHVRFYSGLCRQGKQKDLFKTKKKKMKSNKTKFSLPSFTFLFCSGQVFLWSETRFGDTVRLCRYGDLHCG